VVALSLAGKALSSWVGPLPPAVLEDAITGLDECSHSRIL